MEAQRTITGLVKEHNLKEDIVAFVSNASTQDKTIKQNEMKLDCRDDLVVKGACCPSRGSRFSSQYLHGDSQLTSLQPKRI